MAVAFCCKLWANRANSCPHGAYSFLRGFRSDASPRTEILSKGIVITFGRAVLRPDGRATLF